MLSWNKQYPQAIEILEELVKKDPNNKEYPVRLAEVTLWSGDCTRALKEYEAQLTADFDRPAFWWGFVDAAAGADAMTDGQVRVALAVADKTLRESISRIAWSKRSANKARTWRRRLISRGWRGC